MSPSPKCTVFLTFSVRRKQKIWFWCWLQCQESVKCLTSISYNAGKITVQCFLLLKNLSPNLSPSRDVFVFLEIWSFLWSGGNLVPSLLTATSLQRTQRGGPRFNLVPRDFPWENGRGGDCFTSVPLPLFDSLCVLSLPLGDCWEKFMCSSLPARLMEEFQDSKVYLQHATWLTGEFPSRRISSHFWPVWVRPQDKIQTFNGG